MLSLQLQLQYLQTEQSPPLWTRMRAWLAQRSVIHSTRSSKCTCPGKQQGVNYMERHEMYSYSTWRESPSTNHSGCKSDLPQMISLQQQVVGITKQTDATCWREPWLGCDANITLVWVTVGWGLLMKAQFMAELVPWLILWFVIGAMQQEAQSFLGSSISKSKHFAEDRVTTGCFVLHCLLNMQTCKHRTSSIKTESLLIEYKSKEPGYDISWPGHSFPTGKTQGRGRMSKTPHYS